MGKGRVSGLFKVQLWQGLKPDIDSIVSIGPTEVVPLLRSFCALTPRNFSEVSRASEEHTSGAKARFDLVGFVPGINPRPTARMSFSAACKAETRTRYERTG